MPPLPTLPALPALPRLAVACVVGARGGGPRCVPGRLVCWAALSAGAVAWHHVVAPASVQYAEYVFWGSSDGRGGALSPAGVAAGGGVGGVGIVAGNGDCIGICGVWSIAAYGDGLSVGLGVGRGGPGMVKVEVCVVLLAGGTMAVWGTEGPGGAVVVGTKVVV